ncbi:hypothetical protein OY671_010548, partial [Metschnikowia pulcherrima]
MEPGFETPGTEVSSSWGEPDGGTTKPTVEPHVQTEIKAVVASVPYSEVAPTGMAANNTITFYDLALSTGATISPFVWATKYAVKHKGFESDVVPGGFTGILERTGGKTERSPAI